MRQSSLLPGAGYEVCNMDGNIIISCSFSANSSYTPIICTDSNHLAESSMRNRGRRRRRRMNTACEGHFLQTASVCGFDQFAFMENEEMCSLNLFVCGVMMENRSPTSLKSRQQLPTPIKPDREPSSNGTDDVHHSWKQNAGFYISECLSHDSVCSAV